MSSSDRVIALIDMDCFYVQCEQRLAPDLWGHPCAVAQYNNWKGGGIIAVNYEARGRGVKRGMRGSEAQVLCPEIHVFAVPEVRGKADLTRYRDASQEVFAAITALTARLSPDIIVEKASVDEAYIDLTRYVDQLVTRLDPIPRAQDLPDTKLELNDNNDSKVNTLADNDGEDTDEDIDSPIEALITSDLSKWLDHLRDNVFAFANEIHLTFGALVVQQIRQEIAAKTQFKCSAGISHNKMLAKLACGINKPNAQTLLPRAGVEQLFKRIDIGKVRSLGGKMGQSVKQTFGVNTMYDMKCLDFIHLCRQYDQKTAKWLKDLADGVDDEAVSDRQLSKSIGCGKNFPGKTALATVTDVKHWVKQLCEELVERVGRDKEVNKRSPKLLTVSFKFDKKSGESRAVPLVDDQCVTNAVPMAELVFRQVFSKYGSKLDPMVNLAIAASKFVDECDDPSYNTHKLNNYFSTVTKSQAFKAHDSACSSSHTSAKHLKTSTATTKTIKDFWSNTTNNKSSDNTSSDLLVTNDVTNDCEDNDIEIIETNDESNDSVNNVTNNTAINTTTNSIVNNMTSNSLFKNTINTTTSVKSKGKSGGKSTAGGKSMTDKVATKSVYELLVRKPKKKKEKRGFFYRKCKQLRREEKAEKERQIRERTAKKLLLWERRERLAKSGKTKITGYFKPKTIAKG